MAYLELNNAGLEATLNKEFIETNKKSAYMHTTVNGCNTSKYQGLLVAPIKNFDNEKHVLLSSIDSTITINKNERYDLSTHRFREGNYFPKNNLLITDFNLDTIPTTTYQAGDVKLIKKQLLHNEKNIVLIKYTLEEASTSIQLQLKPFLAFRNIHNLSKSNDYVKKRYKEVDNGISLSLYDNYPDFIMQCNSKIEFVPAPDWYYDIEYIKEFDRGYECLEDLYIPGFFEVELKKGESIIFSASAEEALDPTQIDKLFKEQASKKIKKDSFINTLKAASHQFVVEKDDKTDLIAGYPWHKSITRQTFIALPGISIATENTKLYQQILDTYCEYLSDVFFPDSIEDKELTYNNSDVSLWFIWTIQEYHKTIGQSKTIWEQYGEKIKEILIAYKNGNSELVKMDSNGLIYAHHPNTPLTWMDSCINGNAVSRRCGYTVETNALWYNAICFAIELAQQNKDKNFAKEWRFIKEKVELSFNEVFSDDKHDHIADFSDNSNTDWTIRPNMIIATALDYTPLSKEKRKQILEIARDKLLTKKGIRTLSPDHLRYKEHLVGNHFDRAQAMHLGTAYPWLFRFFAESYLKAYGFSGLLFIKQLLQKFEESLNCDCLGTFSEIYDGSAPQYARGAVSQAWNIANIAYIAHFVETMEENSIK